MTTFPILYSRTSSGKIQTWQVETSGDRFRSTSGQTDGVKTTSEWTLVTTKNAGKANEISGEAQAEAEASAKFKKKIKEGYFEKLEDIDSQLYFDPMLAHKWEDRKDEVNWVCGNYISPKMDGMRTVFTNKGATSRNGRNFVAFPHIGRELEPLFQKHSDMVLDGECYCERLSNDFEKIISLAKKTKPTKEDIVESEKYLEYWIFDFPTLPGGFHERWSAGVKLYNEFFQNNKWIKLCPHTLIKSADEIETSLQMYLEQGFEGLMLNTYDGKYEAGKRSKNILKYKLFTDSEHIILAIHEGKGNRSGMFGYATLQIGDKTFDSNARGNEEFYRRLLRDKDSLVGQMATIRYQNLTASGVPRFPVLVQIRDYE